MGRILGLNTPTVGDESANKAYVDAAIGGGGGGGLSNVYVFDQAGIARQDLSNKLITINHNQNAYPIRTECFYLLTSGEYVQFPGWCIDNGSFYNWSADNFLTGQNNTLNTYHISIRYLPGLDTPDPTTVRVRLTFPDSSSIATSFAATGITQGTAAPITKPTTIVTSATFGVATGVLLPAGSINIGQEFLVLNRAAAATISVYPAVGEQIEALGVNIPTTVVVGAAVRLVKATATQWYII